MHIRKMHTKIGTWTTALSTVDGVTATQEGNNIVVVFTAPVDSLTFTASASQLRANSLTVYVEA